MEAKANWGDNMKIKTVLMHLTGGRPMKFVSHLFHDHYLDGDVGEYEDYFGRLWMAETKWGFPRQRIEEEEDET